MKGRRRLGRGIKEDETVDRMGYLSVSKVETSFVIQTMIRMGYLIYFKSRTIVRRTGFKCSVLCIFLF